MPNETHIFFLVKRTQFWLDVIAKISNDSQNVRLVVIDISHLDYPRQPPWRVPTDGSHRTGMVIRMFKKLGAEYVDGRKYDFGSQDLVPVEANKLRVAVESSMISALRRPITQSKGLSGLVQKLTDHVVTAQSRRAFSLALTVLTEFAPDRAYIVNGRFAAEQACVLAARRQNVPVSFLEINGIFANLFARPYRIQDRVESQRHAIEISSHLSKKHLTDATRRWENEQRNKNSITNPFNKLWDGAFIPKNLPNSGLALFATSSRDEYDSLDIDWKEASWTNQLEAFHQVWGELKSSKFTPVLRVHPNLLNKHPVSGMREIAETRQFLRKNPDFIVVWPSSTVSTYDLLSRADIVVVQNSTIGLEASIQGIPVICTDSSGYDLVADVHRVHRPSDLMTLRGQLTCDKVGAQMFVAAQAHLDQRVERNEAGVEILDHSRIRLLALSILEGSLPSLVFELRWKLYRRLALKLLPK